MTTHGGARAGAGRKGKADKFAGSIEEVEEYIASRMPELLHSLFVLANGVTVQKINREGDDEIYTEKPDRQAAEYLVNRVVGRPIEKKQAEAVDDAPRIIGYIVQTSQVPSDAASGE